MKKFIVFGFIISSLFAGSVEVCKNYAFIYETTAKMRDAGITKREYIEAVLKSEGDVKTRSMLIEIANGVYEAKHLTPKQIANIAFSACMKIKK